MNEILQFSVIRKNLTQLEVRFSPSLDNAALYWTRENNVSATERQLITENAVDAVYLDDPLQAEQRIYFILEYAGKSWLFAERTLPVSGINNFRDMGGYIGAEGKRVKWGMFYRSNHLHNLHPQARAYLECLHVKTIIDYRSTNEIAKSPNCSIGECKTFHLDATAQTAELAAQFAAEPSNEDRALIESVISDIPGELINGQGGQVIEQYRNFVVSEKSKNAFKAMVNVLLDPGNTPNIQHCRGGKDRTGYGALLILSMLGVSEQDIIADYMLTGANRLERNNVKMAAYRQITDNQDVLDYLLTLIDTREVFIVEALNAMKAMSSSVNDYIKTELGFSDADFKTMQDNYLE
ncbi:protein-tyrosine phosphatase [Klebsiella oxytoca]|uniref:Protein-tyrosine phosphatase n=1 Tax=Klebsiella oxytoca TaxID=571 RepID=A0A318FJZ1_KLEOX|nr:tyrosine-protein phosphatase [Klebsiella oxytoca]PXW43904.1 protein-tyrosine phosphatase [Klebsiella oxytoca]